MNLSLKEDSDFVKLYIDGILHVQFPRRYYRGLSSYNNGIYSIEILLKDQTLLLEYDKREDWVDVLTMLDDAL